MLVVNHFRWMNWKIAKCGFGNCISEEEIIAHLCCKTNRVLNSCLCGRILSNTEIPAVWEVDEKGKGRSALRPNFKNFYERCIDYK